VTITRSAETPPSSSRSAKSGEHPAVQAYRSKLESVSQRVTVATNRLDLELQEFLAGLKTPVPPR
jgi:hypothetical protein